MKTLVDLGELLLPRLEGTQRGNSAERFTVERKKDFWLDFFSGNISVENRLKRERGREREQSESTFFILILVRIDILILR